MGFQTRHRRKSRNRKNIFHSHFRNRQDRSVNLPSQREPYNPGATEWGMQVSSDFTVWTYVYDLNGLKSVKLKYRIDKDGENPLTSNQNETYAGGNEVGEWQEVDMTAKTIGSITNPIPTVKAEEYSAKVEGLKDVLVDYYVEATDNNGNVSRSLISHVYVGQNNVSNPDPGPGTETNLGSYMVTPLNPTVNDVITIVAPNGRDGITLHWGVESWTKPIEAYLPDGSVYHSDGKAARTPFYLNDEGKYEVKIGPFNNPAQEVKYISFVTNTGSDWDNNGGSDYKLTISKASGINSVESDNHMTVEYYNLHGVKVENPEHGVYIRREGSTVSKVVLP